MNHTKDAPYDLKCSDTVWISDRTGARPEIQSAPARPLLGAPLLSKNRGRGVSWSPRLLEYSRIPSRIPPDCDNTGVPTISSNKTKKTRHQSISEVDAMSGDGPRLSHLPRGTWERERQRPSTPRDSAPPAETKRRTRPTPAPKDRASALTAPRRRDGAKPRD